MNTKTETEVHPEWYYDIPDMTTLILGTFPPPANDKTKGGHTSRHYDFYYPNKHNRLWPVLATLAGHDIKNDKDAEAVEERKQIMRHLKVGLQNMGKVIERKDKSAKDRDIEIKEYNNIFDIIDRHSTTLKTIVLTGHSGKTSTYRAFIDYINRESHDSNKAELILALGIKPQAELSFILKYKTNQFTCIIANSTSPLTRRHVSFEKLIKQFSKAVFGTVSETK